MIGNFFDGFGGDPGDALVAGLAQPVEYLQVPGVIEELLEDGHRVIAVGLFHQQQVAIGPFIAAERQVVGVAAVVQQFGGVVQPVARLAHQVQANIHQCQFFFQCRCLATPLTQALALNQGAVAEAQQVFDQIAVVIVVHGRPHICPTSAGNS